jgi:HPt (histidine-containing phosphotransfer) domain-containing protein
MLSLFRADGTTRIQELRSAVRRRDAKLVNLLAHTLKGEAMAWGATDLVATSRRLEERSSDGGVVELMDLTAELERLFHASVAALDALRPTTA